MGTKEFRKLNKAELLEVIYRMQLQEQALTEQAELWQQQAQERYDKLARSGNIAEAALGIHNVFEAAQKAADDYVAARCSRIAEGLQQVQSAAAQLQQLLQELKGEPALAPYRDRLAELQESIRFQLAIAPTGETL